MSRKLVTPLKATTKEGKTFYIRREPYKVPSEGRGKVKLTSSRGQGNLMLPRGEMPDSVVGITEMREEQPSFCTM